MLSVISTAYYLVDQCNFNLLIAFVCCVNLYVIITSLLTVKLSFLVKLTQQ